MKDDTHTPFPGERTAEDALRESEDRYRFLVENAPMGILVHTAQGIVYANLAATRIVGYEDPASLYGLQALDFVLPEDRAAVIGRMQEILVQGRTAEIAEERFLRKDGTVVHVAVMGGAVDWEGQPASQVVFHDITERKQAAQAIQEKETLLRAVTEPAKDAIFAKDLNLRYTYCNPAMERLLGLPSEAIVGQTPAELFGAANAAVIEPLDRRNLAGEVVDVTRSLELPDGIHEFHVIQVPTRDASGEIRGISGIVRDVTAERSLERSLLEKDLRYRTATRAGRVGVWELFPEEMRLLSDGSLQSLLGYEIRDRGPAPMERWERTIPKEHQVRVFDAIKEIVEGRSQELNIEYQTRRKDGTLAWVLSKGRPVVDSEGQVVRPLRVFGTTMDISEMYELQQQLRQAQKMEAIGRLAGGIAHDFNNLLTGILGNASLALGRIGDRNAAHKNVQDVIYASKRAAELTQQLLAFSRRQMLDPKLIALNERVERFREMVGSLVGEQITVELKLGSRVGTVRADPGQIEQILANLVVNARDAMPDGGTLSIRTTEVRVSRDEVSLYPGCTPGNYAVVSVRDTGHGMDEETRSRVFEPFFTTKPVGEGTGLGLSTVYGIVRQHDGFIEVRSAPDEGTVFEVYLPRVDETPDEELDDWPAERTPGQGETVLVVEDEEMVRELLKEILSLAGYTVHVAGNAEDALAIMEEKADTLHLLVTDVVMPGRQGGDLARETRRRYPDIKVLFVSGYTEDIIVRQGGLGAGARFIRKPFTPQELQVVVRELLDS
jgi:two-component system cell cycle sensor histidine kinase/response regulator CckA